jgi:hypothetical protein
MPKLWVRDLAGLHCLIRVRLAPIVSNTSHQAIYIAIASPFMPVRFGVKQAMTVHSFIGPQLDNYGQYRALSFADPDRRLSETLLAFKPGIVLVHYWSRCHDQCATVVRLTISHTRPRFDAATTSLSRLVLLGRSWPNVNHQLKVQVVMSFAFMVCHFESTSLARMLEQDD